MQFQVVPTTDDRTTPYTVYVLCDDGTMWLTHTDAEGDATIWYPLQIDRIEEQ